MRPRNAKGKHRDTARPEHVEARRAAVRTAWVMTGIAVAIYAAFLLSGVFGFGSTGAA